MKGSVVLMVVLSLVLPAAGVFADASGGLMALLVDLPGWDGDDPDGADMSYSGMRSVLASRSYESGDKRFQTSILVGSQAQGTWDPAAQEGFKLETPEGLMEVRKIDGFLVSIGFDKTESAGGFLVLIREAVEESDLGCIFACEFEGVTIDEALGLARRFNFRRIATEVGRIK